MPPKNHTLALAFSADSIMPYATTSFLRPSVAFSHRAQPFSAGSTPPNCRPDFPQNQPSDNKSFTVTTGELFLGIAARMLGKRGTIVNGTEGAHEILSVKEKEGESWWRTRTKEKIGAVVGDPIGPEVVWEQSVKDVEAERRRLIVTSPGFSFSAAGLLFPYHLGVAQYLLEKGYIKETTPLAGASAGAIVCAVIASGASMQEALRATKILAEDCRLRGTAFRLGEVLRDVLDQFLPEDAHIRSNGRVRSRCCSFLPMHFRLRTKCIAVLVTLKLNLIASRGFMTVAVTQILWRPRGLLIDQFDSREDLINAVFTSSFIPGYLAPRPATLFRNRICVDGGLTLFMPPTSAAETVRVCAFPTRRLGLQGIGISPDCNPDNRASPRQLLQWALEPASDEILDMLFELGYLDSAVWARDNPVVGNNEIDFQAG